MPESKDLEDPKNNDFIPQEGNGLTQDELQNPLIPDSLKGNALEVRLAGDMIFPLCDKVSLIKNSDGSFQLEGMGVDSEGSIPALSMNDLKKIEAFFKKEVEDAR